MVNIPAQLHDKLRRHGQEHVLADWDRRDDSQRRGLLEQLDALDLDLIAHLYQQREQVCALPPLEKIVPAPVERLGQDSAEAKRLGAEVLDRGAVAVLVVAGGQGSRLGFEQPKGMFPVGPISNHSLFQLHAEKVLALRRRHGKPVPFLVMTSDATDAPTRQYFNEHGWFGLPAEDVLFFQQGTMPAVELATGRLILEAPGRLFTSPNGHGGTLTGLADSGLLDRLRGQGIEHIFYFQVDNPLVKVADAVFLGHHVKARAEVSSKAVAKRGPGDKMGVFVTVDGRCTIIEYSDLPESLAGQTDAQGRLRIWAGSPAIHIFSVEFLSRVTQGQSTMPFHIARKKVPFYDGRQVIQPSRENALKFERFIFDVLPLADRWTVVETTRPEEFEPLKNATGPDSPETVRQAMINRAADWLERAGVAVPRQPDGSSAVALEISPLFALDAEELARKLSNATADGAAAAFAEIAGGAHGGGLCSSSLPDHANQVEGLPFGLKKTVFRRFANIFDEQFGMAGYPDAAGFIQGSAASGYKYGSGEPLNASEGIRPDDYDVAIVSPQLLARAEKLRLNVLKGPLSAAQVAGLGLQDAQMALCNVRGVKVTFKVYRTIQDVYGYGETIPFSLFTRE